MKPKAVLAYCREKGIKSFDLRFVDLEGDWRHITFPLSALNEAAFEEGFGHSILLDRSAIQPGHAILVPQSEANYLDPFTPQPTLILIASVQDAVMREESPLDSRNVAIRAMRYLESTSIGDGLSVRSSFQFRIAQTEPANHTDEENNNSFLACGPDDKDFSLRCDVADIAIESGLHIDRHYCGMNASSEIILKPSNLVECCDDIMMLRYLAGQYASKRQCRVQLLNLWIPSQWSITRQSEPIFAGSAYHGLSDVGLHAIGGILNHVDAIAAIALSNGCKLDAYKWLRMCSNKEVDSICKILVASHNPRARSVEFLGSPARSNPYLVYSAILMAIIDGIQNKTSPELALDVRTNNIAEESNEWAIGSTASARLDRKHLMNQLSEDRDFLSHREVFSDDLIDLLCSRLGA